MLLTWFADGSRESADPRESNAPTTHLNGSTRPVSRQGYRCQNRWTETGVSLATDPMACMTLMAWVRCFRFEVPGASEVDVSSPRD